MGKVFFKKLELPEEKLHLCGVITGKKNNEHWKHKNVAEDYFTLKGYVEGLLSSVFNGEITFEESDTNYYQDGLRQSVLVNEVAVGSIGKIDPITAKNFDIEKTLYAFEIDLDHLRYSNILKDWSYKEIHRYPLVDRDLSFVIDKGYSYQEIKDEMYNTGKKLIKTIDLVDEFVGKNIPKERRSLTFKLVIGDDDKTMTDESINNLVKRVIDKLINKFEIDMR